MLSTVMTDTVPKVSRMPDVAPSPTGTGSLFRAFIVAWIAVAVLIASPPPALADKSDTAELRCLAMTVYWEGRSKSRAGQAAIAHVVLNRVSSDEFPDTICDVVHQGGETPRYACQFSWWCDGLSDNPKNPVAWERAMRIARDSRSGRIKDPTDGALYFHNTSVSPDWAAIKTRLVKIGQHIFYR